MHNTTRIANNNSIVWDRKINYCIGSYNNVITNGYPAKNHTSSANLDIISYNRDSWILRITSSYSNNVTNTTIFSYHRVMMYHNTYPSITELRSFAYLSLRRYLAIINEEDEQCD
ncbi:hypothetical protein PGA7_00001130 [Porphyromonas gingivalis]|nr:hypothetical protein PGA7_00001130 [Porphyromonas gingivalis]